MTLRPRPGPQGSWSIEVGKGSLAFGRTAFPCRDTAIGWAREAAEAVKSSTIRIGSKRILATGAEALRRWAIDQGTMPRAEGGTHLAPQLRLAALQEDPACTIPLAALSGAELAELRRRRLNVLGDHAAMMVEQAALAAAIDSLCELYLPHLPHPFLQPAPDEILLLGAADCAIAIAESARRTPEWQRAIGLLLLTGAAPHLLLGAQLSDLDRARQRLRLATGWVAWPSGLAWPEGTPTTPILAPLGDSALHDGLPRDTYWLTGLHLALRDGRHLDEALALAGLHQPLP
jgi:hypothetical protein